MKYVSGVAHDMFSEGLPFLPIRDPNQESPNDAIAAKSSSIRTTMKKKNIVLKLSWHRKHRRTYNTNI
ncbi:jg2564 [Pararge aegeria aegeria]|uniref:Jg2564 protein n=1 Tax=Pararge aegeria aegeria TaxID=348720 RepID=A0A8S4QWC1_9NEOP|nr:jg2564 [Pararge aegeria aegeria]